MRDKGLCTKSGRPLSPQTFHAMLQKPVYCGWIAPPSMPDLRAKRLHEPLISGDLFNTVQQVLTGRKATPAPKRTNNLRLPLKWFVKCDDCGTPLAGGFSKGRSREYGHYWCRNGSCKAVRTSKANLEADSSSSSDVCSLARKPSRHFRRSQRRFGRQSKVTPSNRRVGLHRSLKNCGR